MFNLWNIKKKEEAPEKEATETPMSVMDLENAEEDVDMDLPNDEEDMHKIIQARRKKVDKESLYDDKSNHSQSYTSSQRMKLNRSLDSKV